MKITDRIGGKTLLKCKGCGVELIQIKSAICIGVREGYIKCMSCRTKHDLTKNLLEDNSEDN